MSKKILSLLLAGLITVATYVPVNAIIKDIEGHWAESTIKEFIFKDYVGGYPDGTFKPNNSITRAEFVCIVNNYFELTNSSGKVFSDTKTHWAKSAIDIAVTNGVCNGKSATEFKPNDPITREEAAVMIANYKNIKDGNHDKLNKYTDRIQVSNWAKDSVEGIIENRYMGGYSDNTFKPKNKITRAEAVVTLSRVVRSKIILPKPESVEVITSANNDKANANISWGAVTGASGYEVYRATSATGTYTLISTTTETSYNNTGLTTNSTYYYKVRAYTMDETVKVYSNFSSIVTTPTPTHSNALFRKKGGGYMNVIIYSNPGWVEPLDHSSSDLEIYIENSQVYVTLYDVGYIIDGKPRYGVTYSFDPGVELDVKVQSTGKILYHKERTDS